MSILLTVFFTFLTSVISFYLWRWTYWKRRGVPGPPSVPLIGNNLELLDSENPAVLKYEKWTKEYGRFFGIQEGLRQVLVVSDPNAIQEIFVKQFDNFYSRKTFALADPHDPRTHVFNAQGNKWKRLRVISNPTFTNTNLKKLLPTVEESVLEWLDHVEKNSNDAINFLDYYQEFTMDVISRIAMGQTESVMFKNPLVRTMAKLFMSNDRKNIVILANLLPKPLVGYLRKAFLMISTEKTNPFVAIMKMCERAVTARIQQREKDLTAGIEPGEPVDFIDLFLDARSDELFDDREFSKENVKVARRLTTDEIIAQCFVFMVAGFDTTALSLSYTTHLLATHPEIQKKVQEEIARECPNPSIDFESLGRLHYLDAVIKETLRLYPLGAFVNSRQCVNTTTVAGIEIEKGTYIQADTWTLHYNKDLWGENAAEFVPERWLEGDVNKNNWIPFGHGPRQCIGMRLAVMEEKLLLAHFIRRFRLNTGVKSEKKLNLIGTMTTQPEAVHLYVKERTDY